MVTQPDPFLVLPAGPRYPRGHPAAGRVALLRGLALLLGLVAALLFAEGLLRGLGVEPPRLLGKRWLRDLRDPLVTYHCYPSAPQGEPRSMPSLSRGDWHLYTLALPPEEIPIARAVETPACVRYQRWAAQTGHKLREPAPRDPPGRRILLIGDSFAFGEGVTEERSLRAGLQRELPGDYEFLNGARIGADTRAEVEQLAQLAPALGASRALLVFIPNDIPLTPALLARQSYINDLINVRDGALARYEAGAWYAGRSRLPHLIGGAWAMWGIRQETVRWYLDSYEPAHNQANLEVLRAALRRAAGLPGVHVALAIYPLLEGLEGRYPLAPIHARVEAMAKDEGLPVLDLLPTFAGQRTRDLWVHSMDHHPNGRGHALAARALAAWLRRLPGFLEGASAPAAGTAPPPSGDALEQRVDEGRHGRAAQQHQRAQ